MSWLTGMLVGNIVCRGQFLLRTHPKGPTRRWTKVPPIFHSQQRQWKQTQSSASNKSTPVVVGAGCRLQARKGHRSKTSEKKRKEKRQPEPTVFLAANQNLMLSCVAHKRESGKRVTRYFHECRGGVEGKEPDIHYSSKSLDEGFKHYLLRKQTPPYLTTLIHAYSDKKEEHVLVGESRESAQSGPQLGGEPGKATFRVQCGSKPKHLWPGLPCLSALAPLCTNWLSPLLSVVYVNITTHLQTSFFFFFLHWLCIHSFCMLVD